LFRADYQDWLKGATGDALHAILCGAGHNLSMTLAHLRVLYCAVVAMLMFSGLTASRASAADQQLQLV